MSLPITMVMILYYTLACLRLKTQPLKIEKTLRIKKQLLKVEKLCFREAAKETARTPPGDRQETAREAAR